MDFTLLLGIGCLLAFCSAIIADRRGKSFAGYFLLGLMLPVIGLLMALALPANKEALEARALKDATARKCPFCAELIRAEAVKCRHCASEVPPLADGGPVKKKVTLSTAERLGVMGFVLGLWFLLAFLAS